MRAMLLLLLKSLLVTMGVPSSVTLDSTHPVMVRANEATAEIATVVAGLPEAERENWARILFVWSAHESAWMADAVGDGGKSIGVMQVNAMWLGQHTTAEVLKDRALGFRIGLGIMRKLVAQCGSMAGGLGAFASGKCGGAQVLVKRRCKLAGASC